MGRSSCPIRWLVLLVLLGWGSAAAASSFGEEKKLLASDAAESDFFGYSVSLHGETALVGAFGDGFGATDETGAAYVFERSRGGEAAWGEVQKLLSPDGHGADRFGWSVAVVGDIAAVGAYQVGSSVGAVFLFYRDQGGADSWGYFKVLTPLDPVAYLYFGRSVAIDGDRIAVGADGDDSDAGAVYLFARDLGGPDNWGTVKKITALDRASGDLFGDAVSISGDWLLVGAPGDDSHQGAAYLFQRGMGGPEQWGQVKKLTATGGAANEYFGDAVAIRGDTAVVGAERDDTQGSAEVYGRDVGGLGNWGWVKKLTASDGVPFQYFGTSVAVGEDLIVVGAYGDGGNIGAAYLFERNLGGLSNWGEADKLAASDGAADDYFGFSVSASGETLLIGAYRNDDDGSNSGAAYVFRDTFVAPDLGPWGLGLLVVALLGLTGWRHQRHQRARH